MDELEQCKWKAQVEVTKIPSKRITLVDRNDHADWNVLIDGALQSNSDPASEDGHSGLSENGAPSYCLDSNAHFIACEGSAMPWSNISQIGDVRQPVESGESDMMPWSGAALLIESGEAVQAPTNGEHCKQYRIRNEQADEIGDIDFDVEPEDWQKKREKTQQLSQRNKRFRSRRAWCAQLVVLWGALSLFVCCIWPQQTSWVVSGLLCQNPYSTVPIMEMLKPIAYETEERSAYLRALKATLQGLAAERGGWTNTSAEENFRDALAELERIHNRNLPLKAYVYAALANLEVDSGRDAEQDLLLAEKLAMQHLGSKNFMVALIERKAAAYFGEQEDNREQLEQSSHMAKSALAIDSAGAQNNASPLVIADERLLAKVREQLRDYSQADQSWSRLEVEGKLVKGANSIDFGLILTGEALFKLRTRHFEESIQAANKAMSILQNQPFLQLQCLVPSYAAGVNELDETIREYLQETRNLKPLALSNKCENTTVEEACYELENRMLQWNEQMKGSSAHFFEVASFADGYNGAGRFQRADKLYKQALACGPKLSGNRWNRQAYFTLEPYLLCMAKTACNGLKAGNVEEASMIAQNCLKIASPYNSWYSLPYISRFPKSARPRTDFYSAFSRQNSGSVRKKRLGNAPMYRELVFGFGADRSNSPEVRKIVEQLGRLLEVDYDSSYLPLLAELEEMQGHDQKAELYYKELAEQPNSPVSIAALATFYHKRGRDDLAGKLFEQEDQLLATTESAGLRTTTSLGKLKYLLALASHENLFVESNWIARAKSAIAHCHTSYEMASHSFEIDLDPIYHDCRSTRSKFADREFWNVRDIRQLADKLSTPEKKNVEAMFPWYSVCFPSGPLSKSDREILAQSLLLHKYPPATDGSRADLSTVAGIIPDHIIVMTSDDARKLQALLNPPKKQAEEAPR